MSKILCTLCKNVLKQSDDVYSTSCGHIFHFICLRESQSRSTCCPQCQHFNASTYKMYLMFYESKDENLPNDCNDNLKIVELQKEIEDSNIKYSHLQDKYLDSLDSVQKLEERLKISNRSISQRAVVFSELEERIKTLEELNEYLTIDTECKSKALTAKSIEIEELQKSLKVLEKSDCVTSDSYVKLKKLEEKFENLTIQLDEEISNSTILSIDNKKFQKYIEIMKAETGCRGDVKSDNANLISNLTEYTKKSLSNSEDTPKNHKQLPQKHFTAENEPKSTILQNSAVNGSFRQIRSEDDSNSYTYPNILSTNLPKNEFKYPTANESQNQPEKNFSKENLTQTNKTDNKKVPQNTAENSLKSIRQDEVLSSTHYYLKNSTENVHKLANHEQLPRNPFKTEKVLENTSNSSKNYPINELNLSNNRTILIKNFPKNDIQYPLKNYIVSLACIKEGYIYVNDVSKVYIKDHNRKKYHQLPQKITLIVEFKNADIKTKFLLNKVQIIQMFPSVELIDANNFNSISAIVDDTNKNDSKSMDQLSKSSVSTEAISIATTIAGKYTTSDGTTNPPINDFISRNNHILLINNFPKNKILYPLKNLIVALPSTKEGNISVNDISKVYIKDNNGKKHHQLPQKITLIVEFINDDIKTKFLLNQVQILQMYQTLELTDTNYYKHIPDDSKPLDQLSSKTSCKTSIIPPAITTAEEGPEVVSSKNQPISELNSSNNHSLLIKNFPKENIQYPLKNLIASMASNKKGYIDVDDINSVQIKNHNGKKHHQLPPKITLFIEFKNFDIKTKFLMNENQIRQIFPLVELVDLNENILKSSRDSQSKDLLTKSSVEETQAAVDSRYQPINEFNFSNNHSLIINNFAKKKLQYPLKNVIVSLAIKKEGYISEDDVSKVYIKDRNGRKHHQLPQKVTLIVEFRNPDAKNKFLLNQDQIYQMYPLLELIDTNNNKGRNDSHPKTDQPINNHAAAMPATKTTTNESHSVFETTNLNNANHLEQPQRTPSEARTSTNNKPSVVSATNRICSNPQEQRSNSAHLATSLTKTTTDEIFTLVENNRHNSSKQRSVSSARSINSNPKGQRQQTLSSARTSTNNNPSAVNTTYRNDLNPHRQRSNSVYTAITPLTKAGLEQTPAPLFSNRNNLKPLAQRQRSTSLAKTTTAAKTSNNILQRVSTTNRIDLKRNGRGPNSLHSATKHNGQLQRSASLARSTATTRTDNIRSTANRKNSSFRDHRQNLVNLAAAIPPASMTSNELAAKYAIRHGYQIKDVNSIAMQSPTTMNIVAATAIEDLLIYAREKLRGNGFEYVFRQNNEVMALKDRNDFEGIKIMNTNHVNELLLSHTKK